ncbi:hypothetical protein [Parasulfitobacter algicola]|uniref:Uncharacterized protein n=1 Tax=Parasulfitobacter algicola TaxID=2614809 RepID=A0ABX2IT28_9RHOB|nr:hypothetical protein [Sulfitobacter algicola]NSX56067.1 hypothetical protein [Sulfitobacter algicola]
MKHPIGIVSGLPGPTTTAKASLKFDAMPLHRRIMIREIGDDLKDDQ